MNSYILPLALIFFNISYSQYNFEKNILSNDSYQAISVVTADIDGDGDLDIIAASLNARLEWFENEDGQGGFGEQKIISSSAGGPVSVVVADIDGDLDLDIISMSIYNNHISIYKNIDGLGNFGPEIIISSTEGEYGYIRTADINSDNFIDIIFCNSEKIAWYKNLDGQGSFSTLLPITTDGATYRNIEMSDIDGDGDIDIVSSAAEPDNRFSWHENIGWFGKFFNSSYN